MNIKLHIKHIWKKLFILPSDGPSGIYRDVRNYRRTRRQDKIRKEKEVIRKIYDLSDMD